MQLTLVQNICNTFLNFVMDEAAIVRQACVYGIGVLASSGEPTLKPRINGAQAVYCGVARCSFIYRRA